MDAAPGSWQMDELEVLAQLVETYEDKRWPMSLPSPAAAIKFRMEQSGLSQRDLEPYIGSSDEVTGVLSGKLPLTLKMIRALHKHLCIPFESLVGGTDASAA
jgi:HTH-type transcriptional regulator/antitoxin HigA